MGILDLTNAHVLKFIGRLVLCCSVISTANAAPPHINLVDSGEINSRGQKSQCWSFLTPSQFTVDQEPTKFVDLRTPGFALKVSRKASEFSVFVQRQTAIAVEVAIGKYDEIAIA